MSKKSGIMFTCMLCLALLITGCGGGSSGGGTTSSGATGSTSTTTATTGNIEGWAYYYPAIGQGNSDWGTITGSAIAPAGWSPRPNLHIANIGGTQSVTTDASGHFLMSGVNVGSNELYSCQSPEKTLDPENRTWIWDMRCIVIAGKTVTTFTPFFSNEVSPYLPK